VPPAPVLGPDLLSPTLSVGLQPLPTGVGNDQHRLVAHLLDPNQIFPLKLLPQVGVKAQGQGNIHHPLKVAFH